MKKQTSALNSDKSNINQSNSDVSSEISGNERVDTIVKYETFEEIEERRRIQRENIKAWNNGLRGIEIQPTLKEEMNLMGDPDFRYVGKGSLF